MEEIEISDEQLMARIVAGDSQALELLYDRYAGPVLGVTLRMLQDRAKAEEIVQEAFWRIWDRADAYDPQRGAPTTWLFGIARRLAIDALRRQKVRPQAAQNEAEARAFYTQPASDQGTVEATLAHIEHETVRAAVAELPPEQYEIIEMAYYKGMTRQEIAENTQTPLGTVHSRARLALQKLSRALQAKGMRA